MRSNKIPFWIIGICAVLSAIIITFGVSLYVDPNLFLDNALVMNMDVIPLINRWGGTMIAIGLTMVIALFFRSVSMLKASLISFCLMSLQDAIIGFTYFNNNIMIRSMIMCALCAYVIIVLNGIKPKHRRRRSSKSITQEQHNQEQDGDDDDDE